MSNNTVPLEVNVAEFGYTTDRSKIIYTRDLSACVGVALLDVYEGRNVRGLAHVFHGGTHLVTTDKGVILPPEEEIDAARDVLTNLRDVMKDVDSQSSPYAFLVDVPYRSGSDDRSRNPMVPVVDSILKDLSVPLLGGVIYSDSNSSIGSSEPGVGLPYSLEFTSKMTSGDTVYSKDLMITPDRLKVARRNRSGNLTPEDIFYFDFKGRKSIK